MGDSFFHFDTCPLQRDNSKCLLYSEKDSLFEMLILLIKGASFYSLLLNKTFVPERFFQN